MTLEEVKNYFGSAYKFNKKTGMHHAAFNNWKKNGYIPIKTQLKLQKFTEGKLIANLDHIPKDV